MYIPILSPLEAAIKSYRPARTDLKNEYITDGKQLKRSTSTSMWCRVRSLGANLFYRETNGSPSSGPGKSSEGEIYYDCVESSEVLAPKKAQNSGRKYAFEKVARYTTLLFKTLNYTLLIYIAIQMIQKIHDDYRNDQIIKEMRLQRKQFYQMRAVEPEYKKVYECLANPVHYEDFSPNFFKNRVLQYSKTVGTKTEDVGRGVNKAKIIKDPLTNEPFAILKPKIGLKPINAHNRILTGYELEKITREILKESGLKLPIIVEVSDEEYAIEYMNGATTVQEEETISLWKSNLTPKIIENFQVILIFDSIFSNPDRHDQNLMWRCANNKLEIVPIDHDLLLTGTGKVGGLFGNMNQAHKTPLQPGVLKWLNTLDRERIDNIFKPYKEQITELYAKEYKMDLIAEGYNSSNYKEEVYERFIGKTMHSIIGSVKLSKEGYTLADTINNFIVKNSPNYIEIYTQRDTQKSKDK